MKPPIVDWNSVCDPLASRTFVMNNCSSVRNTRRTERWQNTRRPRTNGTAAVRGVAVWQNVFRTARDVQQKQNANLLFASNFKHIMCSVFFIRMYQAHTYPGTCITTSVRADSSILEGCKFCGHETTPRRYYIVMHCKQNIQCNAMSSY